MRISDWIQTCALPIWGASRGRDDAPSEARTLTVLLVSPSPLAWKKVQRKSGPKPAFSYRTTMPRRLTRPLHPRLLRRPSSTGGCRSEEHTSELQSLMRISYAVFCLKKTKKSYAHIQL